MMVVDSPNKLNAVITGGGRGIGRAAAISLAETTQYETIIVNYVQDESAAISTCQMIEKLGVRGIPVRANMATPDGVNHLFKMANQELEILSTLVHCAALTTFKPLVDMRANQWDLVMNTNGRSLLLCAQYAVPLMNGGHIIAISSAGGRQVINNYGALGPTKAALESIVRYLAVELAPLNIRVNGIVGGLVPTDSIKLFPESDKLLANVQKRTPAGRLGTTADIGKTVRLLTNPDADWIYGQLIVADGGYGLLS